MGARQVGKIYIAKEFCQNEYKNYESSIVWLNTANIVLPSYLVKNPVKPLEGMKDVDNFIFFIRHRYVI